ncbi:hypothetical protein [Haloarchaeobius sp. DYHT-AS-18]|uniref:hypothetical protein n=1 Tax=Haloarchaeobius sp. DYHT-AS-18 TaxID=3446117 RepID=UPI003EB77906
MAQTRLSHETAVTAHLRVRVPDGAPGDLMSGAATVIARIDDLDAVDVQRITGITPSLNAIEVDVEVTVTLLSEQPDDSTVRADLEEGFGVEAVHEVAIESQAATA